MGGGATGPWRRRASNSRRTVTGYEGPLVGGRHLTGDGIGGLYAYVGNDPLNLTDPSGKDPFIGATVGFIAGAYYGGLGAAGTPGATWKSIVAGAGVGGVVGAGVGALDPSLGVYTLAVVGGVAGGAGDIAGQLIVNYANGRPLGDINYGSTAGAVIGGAIGGAGGTVLGGLAAKAGISELAGTAGGFDIQRPWNAPARNWGRDIRLRDWFIYTEHEITRPLHLNREPRKCPFTADS
jgi:hypothetical protein